MGATPPIQKLLLIGWDAADWKVITPLVDAGLMPNLKRLIESGVMGNLATLHPCLSPILWTSIATGKLADKHGILGFIEPTPDGSGVRLSSSTSRKTKAIWNILSQSGYKTHVVAWYASHPAEPINGVCVSDQFMGAIGQPQDPWPIPAGAVHPPELTDEIANLRVHPAEIRDTDLLPFIPRLAAIDRSTDPRPGKLVAALAKNASVHAAATAILDAEPWDFLAVFYDAIDVVGHDFMIYHPPKLPQVPDRDFELYSGVMNGLYQFHDMMLGRLMQMAGDDTAIVLVSDHGFHSDHLRPAVTRDEQPSGEVAALWHRQYGAIAMRGAKLKRDERLYGATLLDITPTILAMLGLPIGSDMDGRVLIETFEHSPKLARIKSWDDESGPEEPGLHPEQWRQDAYKTSAAVKQLIDLGYLPATVGENDQEHAAQVAVAEAQFNLGIVYLQTNRSSLAKPIFEQLVQVHPENGRYALAQAKCFANLAMHHECRRAIESLESRYPRTADGDLLLAGALFNTGETEAAMRRLHDAERLYPPSSWLYLALGTVHLARHAWSDAQRAFDRAIQLEEDNAQAHHGLANALLEQQQFEAAAEHALRATGLLYHFPAAHYQLGLALEGMGERARAIRAMEIAVTIAGGFVPASKHLAQLYRATGNVARALHHERAVQGYAPVDSGASVTDLPRT